MGNTGSAINTSPHLHFSVFPGVYTDGIDPFPLLESVDHTACADEPPVGPAEPIVSFSSDATGSDFRPEGASQGIADVYEDDTVTVRFYVHADADGGDTVGKVVGLTVGLVVGERPCACSRSSATAPTSRSSIC